MARLLQSLGHQMPNGGIPHETETGNARRKLTNMATSRIITLSITLAASACGRAAGTQPHDMSAAQHQAAAAREEDQATQHAAQHDPGAEKTEKRCSVGRGRVCWTATTNPTQGHVKTAEEHRELAAQHRAASQALQDAEALACTGIDEADRDVSPFAHSADIRSVGQFREVSEGGNYKNRVSRDAGATIAFRATPGLTVEWLQRIVDCHLARNSAVGHDMPEMAYCPLVPLGAQATVRSVGDGFAVDVHADDAETAGEIWRRAQQINPAR
jgi:acetylornithine deacetylase/succinyl-diaminopimelate desuccinylase-like protein